MRLELSKNLSDYGPAWFEQYRGTPFFAEALGLERVHMKHELERKQKKVADQSKDKERTKLYDEMAKIRAAGQKQIDALQAKMPKYDSQYEWDQAFYTQHDAKMAGLRAKYLEWCEKQAVESATKEKTMSKSNAIFDEILSRDISDDILAKSGEAGGAEPATQAHGMPAAPAVPVVQLEEGEPTPEFGGAPEGYTIMGGGGEGGASSFGFKIDNMDGTVSVAMVEHEGMRKASGDSLGIQQRAAAVAAKRAGLGGHAYVTYSNSADEAISKAIEESQTGHVLGEPQLQWNSPLLKSHKCAACGSVVSNALTVCHNCGR